MNDEELRKLVDDKKLARSIILHAIPIDFAKLIKDGMIKKIGRSYYTDNMKKLPRHVGIKIRTVAETKNGLRLTFDKITKTDIKKAEKLKKLGYKETL